MSAEESVCTTPSYSTARRSTAAPLGASSTAISASLGASSTAISASLGASSSASREASSADISASREASSAAISSSRQACAASLEASTAWLSIAASLEESSSSLLSTAASPEVFSTSLRWTASSLEIFPTAWPPNAGSLEAPPTTTWHSTQPSRKASPTTTWHSTQPSRKASPTTTWTAARSMDVLPKAFPTTWTAAPSMDVSSKASPTTTWTAALSQASLSTQPSSGLSCPLVLSSLPLVVSSLDGLREMYDEAVRHPGRSVVIPSNLSCLDAMELYKFALNNDGKGLPLQNPEIFLYKVNVAGVLIDRYRRLKRFVKKVEKSVNATKGIITKLEEEGPLYQERGNSDVIRYFIKPLVTDKEEGFDHLNFLVDGDLESIIKRSSYGSTTAHEEHRFLISILKTRVDALEDLLNDLHNEVILPLLWAMFQRRNLGRGYTDVDPCVGRIRRECFE